MKKILFAAVFFLSFSAFAADPSAKVLASFHKQFPQAENVHWTVKNETAIAYFKKEEITYNLTYDEQGRIISSILYYSSTYLPFFLKTELQRRYENMTVYGVTELTVSGETVYEIHLQDAKTLMTIRTNQHGNWEEKRRYHRRVETNPGVWQ